MLRTPNLPFQPGYVFDSTIGQTRFHKSQHFTLVNNMPVLANKDKPGIGGAPIGPNNVYPSLYNRSEATDLPPWIAYDKQILRFKAFFQETMQEVSDSPFQVREVNIYFFLEDATVQIIEPPVDNSGMSGGCLVRRQRVPFPPPRQSYFYDIIDFNVGKEIEIFGRVYKITDCDQFTRTFLNRCGIPVQDPIGTPNDPYKNLQKQEKAYRLPKRVKPMHDTLGPFLKYDKQALCFWGYWDDRDSEYGVLHKLEIHFFLCDETVEIKEHIPPNSGRDGAPLFLKRVRLPKIFSEIQSIGKETPISLLNVLEGNSGLRSKDDVLNSGAPNTEYYKEQDFVIGAVINVFKRKVVLTDCDTFTKEYYRVKYGIDDFTPLSIPPHDPECKVTVDRSLPPYNGFGTYEDSEQNCRKCELKVMQKDLTDFLTMDRYGYNSYQLRFGARLLSKVETDRDRYFVITYYLMDKTISIFELACRNTGFLGGKFMRRTEVYLPGEDKYGTKKPRLYQPEHFYVGAQINIAEFKFKLIDADEYCFHYMELHQDQFPKSNINLILHNIREALRTKYREFVAENEPKPGPSIIAYDFLRNAINKYMKEPLTEHEMITIARNYSPACYEDRFTRNDIRQIVLTELKRGLWNDLQRFAEGLRQMDPRGTGYVSRINCYNLLRAARLPLDLELIPRILDVLTKNKNCDIYYQDLINFVDLSHDPLPDVTPENFKRKLSWLSERPPKRANLIDWNAFNKALDLEKEIAEQSTATPETK